MLSRTPLYARRVAAVLGAPHSRFLSAAPSYLELNEGQKKLSDIVAGSPKVLAYFTAAWCGPCKAIGPHFAALAKDNGQAVQFVKVDVDDNATTMEEASITSVPTFKSFAHGKVVGQFTGANKDTLTAAVKSLVDA